MIKGESAVQSEGDEVMVGSRETIRRRRPDTLNSGEGSERNGSVQTRGAHSAELYYAHSLFQLSL